MCVDMLWHTQQSDITQHHTEHHFKVSVIQLTIRRDVNNNILYTLCIKCLQTSHMFCLFLINRTNNDDMTGVKSITKKALHHLAGHRLVSIQEAVHMWNFQLPNKY